jgi:hypothetical protein
VDPGAPPRRVSKSLVGLVLLATVLSLGHTIDHIARGDLGWPLGLQSLPFIVVTLAIYGTIGGGLYLYLSGKVGALFWAIIGALGIALGWLAHFSPFTDQPLRYIFGSYRSQAAGWLALGCLVALMIVMAFAAVHAVLLWRRGL